MAGSSYLFMDMPLDHENPEMARMIKRAQAAQFSKMAAVQLFVQKQMFNELKEENKKREEETLINDFKDLFDVELSNQDLSVVIADIIDSADREGADKFSIGGGGGDGDMVDDSGDSLIKEADEIINSKLYELNEENKRR